MHLHASMLMFSHFFSLIERKDDRHITEHVRARHVTQTPLTFKTATPNPWAKWSSAQQVIPKT